MPPEKRKMMSDERVDDAGHHPFNPPPRREKKEGQWGMSEAYYRDLYRTDPNFRQLATQDPDFARMSVLLSCFSYAVWPLTPRPA
jgi:hypothetical protein